MREEKALTRLCVCAGMSERSLLADAINTKNVYVVSHMLNNNNYVSKNRFADVNSVTASWLIHVLRLANLLLSLKETILST